MDLKASGRQPLPTYTGVCTCACVPLGTVCEGGGRKAKQAAKPSASQTGSEAFSQLAGSLARGHGGARSAPPPRSPRPQPVTQQRWAGCCGHDRGCSQADEWRANGPTPRDPRRAGALGVLFVGARCPVPGPNMTWMTSFNGVKGRPRREQHGNHDIDAPVVELLARPPKKQATHGPPLATPGPGPGPPVEPALRRAGAHTYTCKTYMCKRTAKHPKTFKN
jgi:hypothetical protein